MSWLQATIDLAARVEGALGNSEELLRLAREVVEFARGRNAAVLMPASEQAGSLTAAAVLLAQGSLESAPFGAAPSRGPVVIVEALHASGAGFEDARRLAEKVEVVGELAVASVGVDDLATIY